MITTRNELKEYALSICRTMLERTASRYENGILPTVTDHKGYIPTLLEEFCRPFWGLAPVIAESQEDITLTFGGKTVPLWKWLCNMLSDGLTEGTDKTWDRYRFNGSGWGLDFQNLTELAGLFIGMYFCREKTWDRFSPENKKLFADRIFSFCKGQCEKLAENNHIWFPLFCVLVLKKLGFSYPETEHYLTSGLEALEKMYISDGWYSDGDFGRFDYYEVWSMHAYPLIWCIIEDDTFPGYKEYRSRYTERTEKFISQYIYAFDCDGAFAAFGRSLAYKFAAVCIFPLAAMAGCNINYGLARHILLKNISYFADNMHLNSDGTLPTGFMYESSGLVENYTADGGAYWCTKSFLCLLMKEDHPFWKAADVPSPIENGDFLVKPHNKKITFTVSGTKACGITVYNNVSQYFQRGIYCNPFNDMASYYCKFAYNSKAGFAVSTRDNTSFDSMISLQTSDRSMASHRWGYTDCGRSGEILLSHHFPFSNDRKTYINTALLPLKSGCHVRLHRVTLSQEYAVREGGFSLGLWSDYHTENTDGNTFTMENGSLFSRMSATSSVTLTFSEARPQPGLHLMAPLSCYPSYTTEVLPAGTYYFASVYRISGEKEYTLPTLHLEDGKLTVEENGKKYEIPFSLFEKM